MLAENLKALRKAKGLSQEELAARLHVVRQTVSKWEKGRSVPDADLLIRLAEELDTTSAALLGPEVPPEAERGGTAEQLARIAEQLAVKNRRARRIWRIVAGVLIAFVMVNLLLILLNFAAFRSFQAEAESTVHPQQPPGVLSKLFFIKIPGAGATKIIPPAAVCLGDHVRPRVLLRNLPLPA